MPEGKVQRYWPGRAPKAGSDSSGSDVEEQEPSRERNSTIAPKSPTRSRERVVVQAEVIADEGEEEDEDDRDARRERLRAKRKERREEEEEEELLPLEDEDDFEEGEGAEDKDEEKAGSGSSSSSEFETGSSEESEEETIGNAPRFLRPVFIAKGDRKTIQEREELEAKEVEKAELDKVRRLEQIEETRQVIADTVKAEVDAEALEDEFEKGLVLPDDTDYDETLLEEREKWKLREVQRVRREQEEEERAAGEEESIRNLSKEERELFIKERLKKDQEARQNKSKLSFMQKYYHKGAFFMDDDGAGGKKEGIYNRNFNEATEEEAFDKSMLPKPMQVRRGQQNMSGRSKYTHLLDQDTTMGTTYGNKPQAEDNFLPRGANHKASLKRSANDFDRPRGFKKGREG